MIILGISNSSHDSSSAIVVDGLIVAASEEEKFDRIKHGGKFPFKSIAFCLKKAAVGINDVSQISISMNWLKRAKSKFENSFSDDDPCRCVLAIQQADEDLQKRIETEKILREDLGYRGKIEFLDHHDCHAAACYFTSNFRDSAIITVDGAGEEAATRIYKAVGSKMEKVIQINFPNSLGALYSLTTAHLGFKIDSDEGKVMGLAPYGNKSLVKKFGKILSIDNNGFYHIKDKWLDFFKKGFSEEFVKKIGVPKRNVGPLSKKHKNLAFAVQNVLERAMMGLVKLAKEKTKSNYLCLGGGVALNSVVNGKIIDKNLFSDMFIYPASGDGGTAVGAALYSYHAKKRSKVFFEENKSPYLGYEASRLEIIKALNKNKLKFRKLDNIEEEVAGLLASNKIIALFSGRTEFGPRALGNRSILADPRRASNKDIINSKIKFRESFRPFAPVVANEFAKDYFLMHDVESPYMILAFKVKKNKKNIIPAVTHIDGTARVQTIKNNQNHRYWKIINEFYKITGVPVLLNTSFNLAGEVIVNTPEEAVSTFLKSGIDGLVLENYLIVKN